MKLRVEFNGQEYEFDCAGWDENVTDPEQMISEFFEYACVDVIA